MTLRDVTGRVSRWTLILHRDEQGFCPRHFAAEGKAIPRRFAAEGKAMEPAA